MSFIVVGIVGWSYVSASEASTIQLITIGTAVASITTAIVAWLNADKKTGNWLLLSTYYVTLVAAGMLIHTSGGLGSPYVFLWVAPAIAAGVFGRWGFAPVIALSCIYLIVSLFSGSSVIDTAALLALLTPIGLSLFLWYRHEPSPEAHTIKRDIVSAELKSLSSEADTLVNAIGDGVLAIDAAGTIRLINPAASTMLGWSRQDALSLNYKSVLKLADEQGKELPNTVSPIEQALNTNQEARDNRLTITTKNDKKRYVSVVASPLGEAGSGLSVVVRDITKERIEEHQQTEFISTASHEMRTPVASIEGYLGLALNPSTATIDEKARDYITKAHEAAQHLGHLFKDLLDVSKAEDGRLSNNPQAFNIVDLVSDITESLQPKASEKGLDLVFKPAPNLEAEHGERRISPVYYVNLDKDHVRETVSNLVENAIKYTPVGQVSVDVTGSGEHVTISITDSGIGIPAEDLSHLFQKFYRVDNTDTREIGGTGLGLYLCRRLVESMNGRIWAESIYKQGSTFFVELPRIDSQEAQQLLQQTPATKNTQIATPFPFPGTTPATTAPPSAPPTIPIVAPSVPTTPPPVSPAEPQPTITTPPAAPAPLTPPAQPKPTTPAPTPSAAPKLPSRPLAPLESPSSLSAPSGQPITVTAVPTPPSATVSPISNVTSVTPRPTAAATTSPVVPTRPASAAPAPTPVTAPTRPNVPLSVIEQDPAAYIQSQLSADRPAPKNSA